MRWTGIKMNLWRLSIDKGEESDGLQRTTKKKHHHICSMKYLGTIIVFVGRWPPWIITKWQTRSQTSNQSVAFRVFRFWYLFFRDVGHHKWEAGGPMRSNLSNPDCLFPAKDPNHPSFFFAPNARVKVWAIETSSYEPFLRFIRTSFAPNFWFFCARAFC